MQYFFQGLQPLPISTTIGAFLEMVADYLQSVVLRIGIEIMLELLSNFMASVHRLTLPFFKIPSGFIFSSENRAAKAFSQSMKRHRNRARLFFEDH